MLKYGVLRLVFRPAIRTIQPGNATGPRAARAHAAA
jgi:hypothetical protein